MDVIFKPGRAQGRVFVPPSKSYAHRLLLSAALTGADTAVNYVNQSDDISATLSCIEALGGGYSIEGASVRILCPVTGEGNGILPCRESGSTLRFFLPVALALREETVFTGTRRLMERGIALYEELLTPGGVTLEKGEESLTVRGRLCPGSFTLRGDVSSQYVTGLLYALPLLDGESVLTVMPPLESRPYVDMTLDVLKKSGITVHAEGVNRFVIPGNQRYCLPETTVEGDWSNAAFFCALRTLGHPVDLDGLNPESVQGDRACLGFLKQLQFPGAVIDLSQTPDLGPVLFAAAALLHGATFVGIRRLRLKESDRVQAMQEELEKLGVTVRAEEDRADIIKNSLHNPKIPLCGHNDHRVVMALSLLCASTGGTITGAEAVSKSYPAFFDDLAALGLPMTRKE